MEITRFRTRVGFVVVPLVAVMTTACGLDSQAPPPLIGPSGLGSSVSLTASPDQLPRDGRVQSSALRTIISRQQDRACVLLDRWSPQRQSLEALGAEVLGETSLTLEELFIALMKTGRARWQPKLSAA